MRDGSLSRPEVFFGEVTWTCCRHLGDVFYPDCSRIMSNPAAGCPQIAGENRPTRTQSVQDRIISETHSSLLQRGSRGKGAAAPFPCTPNPRRTSSASLRTTSPGPSHLTKPNTSCTIITPASLRADCCSPSPRNAVRLASGIDVHLHRNTQRSGRVRALVESLLLLV